MLMLAFDIWFEKLLLLRAENVAVVFRESINGCEMENCRWKVAAQYEFLSRSSQNDRERRGMVCRRELLCV